MIEDFNKYRFFLNEGGRGSAKTQSTARFLLYLAEKNKVRIVCGRETQSTIDESVYKVLTDLIAEYSLDFKILSNKITHNKTGSEFLFKGFREQGRANVKGLEGVDVLWIDEAEAITKQTLDVIVPTVRKPNSKIIFTMNRFVRNDPVFEFCNNRDNALIIHIDYFDNPFCPQELKDEAEACKQNNIEDYKHIWLGQPLANASDYLFNFEKLDKMKEIKAPDEGYNPAKVIGIDFASKGGDLCVATVLERCGARHWRVAKQEAWAEPEPTVSIGRIVNIISAEKPTCATLDIGGMGHVVHSRLKELGIKIEPFDGATTQGVPSEYLNARAYGYYTLNDWINNELILMDNNETIRELEQIRYDYKSDGTRLIMSKEKMRSKGVKSPDRADSLMMAVYCAKNHLGRVQTLHNKNNLVIKTTSRWKGR